MIRVMVADDDAAAVARLERLLTGWEFDVTTAASGRDAWEILAADQPPDIVLMTWELPDLNGVEVVSRLRRIDRPGYVYVIMLTARSRRQDMITALQAGVDLFLAKPFDPSELLAHMQGARRVIELKREILRLRSELGERRATDELTGLVDKDTAVTVLEELVLSAASAPSWVLVVDVSIDALLKVRRAHGAEARDHIIAEVARRLATATAGVATVARTGADRFEVVGTFDDRHAADQLVHDLHDTVGRERLVLPSGRSVRVTATVGACVSWGPTLYHGHRLPLRAARVVRSLRARGDRTVRMVTFDVSRAEPDESPSSTPG